MRIKSRFHDYYDSIQSLGQNQELLYLRYDRIVELRESRGWRGRDVVDSEWNYIGFCGKVYPVLRLKYFPDPHSPWINCYSIQDVDN